MNTKKRYCSISRLLTTACCVAVMAWLSQPSEAQSRSKGGTGREVYTGTIFYFPGPTVGGPGRTRTTSRTFTLTLNCTTPRAEINRLAGILKSDGQDGLLRAIVKEKCGVIQLGAGVGRDINTISVTNAEEGERKITMLFERWLEFFEVRYGTRSRDYPFTYIELFVNDKGKLEGTMIPAAKVRFIGENTVEIENFAAYPARMTGIQRNK
jgi:hypothetical protein